MDIPKPILVIRNVTLLVIFLLGCISIVTTQVIFSAILLKYPSYKQSMINHTKRQFVQLVTFVLSVVSPIKISVTYDPELLPESNSFKSMTDGIISNCLSPNSIMISNHQIYTDWYYLWFICYSARLADNVFIILKDMSKVPILGTGMKNFNFLFLSRKWQNDKIILTNQLLEIDANARGSGPASGIKHVASANVANGIEDIRFWPQNKISDEIYPYEIILYPEGTVPSKRTKAKSQKFCLENNLPRLNHVLLPRVRGLFLSLRKLRNTIEVVYDITTGYSGLNAGDCGEDIFTLKGTFIFGTGPKQANFHIRSFKISEIPLGEETLDIDDVKEEDLKNFEDWLFKIWYEKDRLMDQFYKTGSFETANTQTVVGDVKLRSMWEAFPIFSTLGLIFILAYLAIKVLIYIVFK